MRKPYWSILADITPDAYPLLLAEPPDEPEARHAWWEQHMAAFWAERDRYACAIAERIRQRDAFREKALALNYTDAEIDDVYQTCRMLLQKRRMFVPLEILFTKHATPASRAALLANEELTWMFSQMSPRSMRKYLDRLPPRTRESCQAKLDAADQSTQKEGNDGTIGDGQM
ncbi:MAG: hypothetical protein IKI21_07765 [Oscillospiraceae bacterium]|nr:hypothetical protein [Oscillospiraceae bacterium]